MLSTCRRCTSGGASTRPCLSVWAVSGASRRTIGFCFLYAMDYTTRHSTSSTRMLRGVASVRTIRTHSSLQSVNEATLVLRHYYQHNGLKIHPNLLLPRSLKRELFILVLIPSWPAFCTVFCSPDMLSDWPAQGTVLTDNLESIYRRLDRILSRIGQLFRNDTFMDVIEYATWHEGLSDILKIFWTIIERCGYVSVEHM